MKSIEQTDSQVQSQVVNQPRITTTREGTSDVKQKGLVRSSRQHGKMYALGQQEVQETSDIIIGKLFI